MIEIAHLTKRFGAVTAVDDLSFSVRPGAITGFLGPNGAGKTTTLRVLLGLVTATAGAATIDGKLYREIRTPGRVVGAALEASSYHPGRSGLGHLRVYAPQLRASDKRCREMLDLVGLAEAADRRVSEYSLGMRQRLALAMTLLGDPPVLVLDEPANGLDPGGIVWLRELLRRFAGDGRTVLISSHVLGEVQQTVDDVVIIANGRLVHESSLADLALRTRRYVEVVSPNPEVLQRLLDEHAWSYAAHGAGYLVHDVNAAEVGAAAFAGRVELHALTARQVQLEDVFFQLTRQVAR